MLEPESFISGEKCALENTCWSIRMLFELRIIDFSIFDRIVDELKSQAKEIDWMGENILDKKIGAMDRVEKCVKEVYDQCH